MSSDSNSHRAQVIIALIGLAGTVLAALIANWDRVFPPDSVVRNGVEEGGDQAVSVRQAAPPQPSSLDFAGTYVGYSTEGVDSYPTRIRFRRDGNRVTGSYVQAGQRGSFQGVVTGDALHYDWSLGGMQGRGISVMQGAEVIGTWGYGSSVDNGGTLRVTPQ